MTRAALIAAIAILCLPTPAGAAMEHEEIVARLATGQAVPGYRRWKCETCSPMARRAKKSNVRR